MSPTRQDLLKTLEAHYRSSGWTVKRASEGTLYASGPGGVTWLGTALTAEDLADEKIEERIADLAERRMPDGGELCPLDLLPAAGIEDEVRALLDRLGLSDRRHVSVYSLAA